MNEQTATGPAQSRLRWLRPAAMASALAGAVLLAVACGGPSTGANTFAPGATYTQALAFTKCMRSNGVSQFPAPDGQGSFSNAAIQALENDPQENNAMHQCRSVLPNAGTGLTSTQLQEIQQQNLRNAVKAAHCMRAHGVTNFPDPAGSTQSSGVNWQSAMSAGLNLNAPYYAAAYKTCGRAIPPNLAPGAVPPSGAPSGSGGGS
ncbi:MAG TPA: hypothetical protein VGM53_28110 [Streptosporangiaceae bacterium]